MTHNPRPPRNPGRFNIAGNKAAKDRIEEVKNGVVWTYHLKQGVVSGVQVAQGASTTWLLTKAGVRPIQTADIQLIYGTCFKRLGIG